MTRFIVLAAILTFCITCPNAKQVRVPDTPEKPTLFNHLLQNFIVVPEYKLLFCYIEKVGNKNFNILFNRLRHRYDKNIPVDNRPQHVWMNNNPNKFNMSKEDLENMLIDKKWHKAVFYRDPLERFVSAFQNKCQSKSANEKYWCAEQFGSPNVTFQEAVLAMQKLPLHEGFDPQPPYDNHFSRQLSFCGGLNQTLKYYDTVEQLSIQDSHEKVTNLLDRIGAKPPFGFAKLFPAAERGAISRHNRDEHNTDSASVKDEYFDGDAMTYAKILRDHYDADYKLFHMSPPTYAKALGENATIEDFLHAVNRNRWRN